MDSLSSISKKFIAFYLGWIFIHVLLFINGKDYSGFYPFDDGIAKVKDYGSIELIVYLGVPLIGFIIYSLLKTKDGSQFNNSDSGDIFSTLKEKSTIEIIAKLKSANSDKNMVETDSLFIEFATYKMECRQFDDAEKLIMQLTPGEARDFLLNELTQKRKV